MNDMKWNAPRSRRSFLKLTSAFPTVYCLQSLALGANQAQTRLRFGLIADVHQDIMHDAGHRVRRFVEAMHEAKVDFICQLGDFCWPHERNRAFLAQWNQFQGPRYHVLGNHDMDGGFTRDQTVAYLDMPNKHYSFDQKGIHFVVLDGNEPGGQSTGYKRYIAEQQLNWITQDLHATSWPSVVFSHQALDDASGIENSAAVRQALEQAQDAAGVKKVVACFCGHHHDDQARRINGIHYMRINSASYYWLPAQFKHQSYSAEIHQAYPWIEHTAPYREPLWALVEIDVSAGRLSVTGRNTDWVGPSPWTLGASKEAIDPRVVAPRISNRVITFPRSKPKRLS